MAVAALKGPHVQAKGYRKGRAYRNAGGVKWIVVHTAEGARDELDLGNFFKSRATGSSNAGIGQDGGYATYVNYGDTAWTNAPLNEESDTVELCGFAKWGRSDWLKQTKMLDTLAKWIAWRCAVRKVPVRYVAKPGKGTTGVTGHRDVNAVYKQSSHWDPGPQFPWDTVIAAAQRYANIKPPSPNPNPPPIQPGNYVVKTGDSYWKIAQAAYKDGNKWPTISKANANKSLKPGLRITIPGLSSPPKPPPPAPRIDLPAWPGYGYVAKGKRNGYVQKMQNKLRRMPGLAAFNPSGATGFYGDETIALVKAFQRNKPQLWASGAKGPDGICGPKTWAAIDVA